MNDLKVRKIVILGLMLIISANTFSQGISKKEIRKKSDSTEFINIQRLIGSKNFEFSANQVLPQSSASLTLTTNEYWVKIKQDSIFCELPFFGRVYNINPFNTGGFYFSNIVTDYQVKVNQRKQKIEIVISSKNQNDYLKFFFTIIGNKNASLSVMSDNRASISYLGEMVESR